jgi:hypothetical protein
MQLNRYAVLPTLIFFLASPPPALAWDKAGHRIVATVAMSLLSPESRNQVTDLLGPNLTLAEVSTCAGEIRSSRPNTGPSHYVNISRDATAYNVALEAVYLFSASRVIDESYLEKALQIIHAQA